MALMVLVKCYIVLKLKYENKLKYAKSLEDLTKKILKMYLKF